MGYAGFLRSGIDYNHILVGNYLLENLVDLLGSNHGKKLLRYGIFFRRIHHGVIIHKVGHQTRYKIRIGPCCRLLCSIFVMCEQYVLCP